MPSSGCISVSAVTQGIDCNHKHPTSFIKAHSLLHVQVQSRATPRKHAGALHCQCLPQVLCDRLFVDGDSMHPCHGSAGMDAQTEFLKLRLICMQVKPSLQASLLQR